MLATVASSPKRANARLQMSMMLAIP
jgi:hypothetical protein